MTMTVFPTNSGDFSLIFSSIVHLRGSRTSTLSRHSLSRSDSNCCFGKCPRSVSAHVPSGDTFFHIFLSFVSSNDVNTFDEILDLMNI